MISPVEASVLDQIGAYDGSLLRLGRLIADLDALWVARTDWLGSKRRSFRSSWGVLEQIYAEALDKQSKKLSAKDIFDSRVILNVIKELIRDGSDLDLRD